MPDLFLQLEKLIQLGDLEQAQALQFKINEVIAKLVAGSGHLYAVAKEV